MADAILSADRLRAVVEYDPETGVFVRKVRLAQRHQAGDRADFRINKGPMTGYRRLSLDSKRFLAHRCAWLYVHGDWPQGEIDHINGDPGDNRIENLRVVEAQTNAENKRRARSDSRSGLLGFLFLAGLHRGGALLEAEAVRLADNGIAADAAELVGDLAGGGAIVPHLLQALDALVGPRHLNFAPKLARLHGSR